MKDDYEVVEFKNGELEEESMCANFAHMGKLNVQEYKQRLM